MKCSVGKTEFEARMPSLNDLAPIKALGDEAFGHAPMKAFVKAVIPKDAFESLLLRHPTCFTALGMHILAEAGVGGHIAYLEPAELDEEFAAVFVEKEAESRRIYPDPDDERGKLFPFIFKVGDEERRALFRSPKEREVEALLKADTPAACKSFLTTICVHGDMGRLEAEAPGKYLSLAALVMQRVDADAEIRVGKS